MSHHSFPAGWVRSSAERFFPFFPLSSYSSSEYSISWLSCSPILITTSLQVCVLFGLPRGFSFSFPLALPILLRFLIGYAMSFFLRSMSSGCLHFWIEVYSFLSHFSLARSQSSACSIFFGVVSGPIFCSTQWGLDFKRFFPPFFPLTQHSLERYLKPALERFLPFLFSYGCKD